MILRMYAIRDSATDQFGNVMFLVAEAQAVRSFSDEVNRGDPTNMLNAHPEHFSLYSLGDFDTNIGEFKPMFPPRQVVLAESVFKRPN